jgi:hypothetical protein
MCWECDHPNATREDYLNFVRERMSQHGWAVQGVQGDRHYAPWAYTVGLTAFGKPELAVTGTSQARASDLLHSVAPHLLHADAPQPGERVRLTGGPLIEIVQVAEPAVHLVTAVELFGHRVRALQLVYADDRGHWPWDAGFRGGRGGQPVLGARARQRAA